MTKAVKIDERMLDAINSFSDLSFDSIEEAGNFLMHLRSLAEHESADEDSYYCFGSNFIQGIVYTKNTETEETISVSVEYKVDQIEALKQICELLLNGEQGVRCYGLFKQIGDESK